MSSTYQMKGLERDLALWLRSNDPGPLPEAARTRAFRDLHRLAPVAGARDSWPRLGLAAAAFMLVVIGIALAVLGAGSPVGPIGGSVSPSLPSPSSSGQAIGVETDWGALFGLVVVSALVGLVAFIPHVGRVVARLLFGRSPEADLPLRPIGLGSTTPLTWLMGLLALVDVGLTVWLVVSRQATIEGPGILLLLVFTPAFVIQSMAVPMRYPMQSRSSRLLVTYMAVVLGSSIVDLASFASGSYGNEPLALLDAGASLVTFFAAVALAAGLARRSGFVARPPLAAAAMLVAVTIGLRLAPFVPNVAGKAPEPIVFETLLVVAFSLGDVALLAGAWVCFSTSQTVGRWVPWAAAGVACVSLLIESLPMRFEYLLQAIAANYVDTRLFWDLGAWWWSLTSFVAALALSFAFLSGLPRAERRTGSAADDELLNSEDVEGQA